MIWHGKNDEREDYTFNDLKNLTDKFAAVLKNLGVKRGRGICVHGQAA